jgi:hypothetical protein
VTTEIIVTAALAFFLNVPLGLWRVRCRRYSAEWFAAIHASIPVIVGLRIAFEVPWAWAPLFVSLAVAGQWIGGRISAPCRSA